MSDHRKMLVVDDEAAVLFGNVLHWQMDALPRQSPALPSTHAKLVRRVKPLYRLSELLKTDLPILVVEGEKCADVEVPGAGSVPVATVNALTLEQWIGEFERLTQGEPEIWAVRSVEGGPRAKRS